MTPVVADFARLTPDQTAAAARILRDALAHQPAAYTAPDAAAEEVALRLASPDWLGYAVLEGETVLGWIGALRTYSHGWELHPLVVDPAHQRRGIGSGLIRRLEERARAEGVLTLYLGTDDDFGGTTLFGRDLFPDPLAHAAALAPAGRGHPFTFYQRHGYRVVGLFPDVNGPGRPDIFMAKRL
jgi:aminoglycoside 6'-N-acetyltransferase I